MSRNFITDIGAVLIALFLGVGAGYWYGSMVGFQDGITFEKDLAAKQTVQSVNPFTETSVNPFDQSGANPYENIKTNPFE